jgi:hypothetical protein
MSTVTKEEVESLSSIFITKIDYDKIINKINERFTEICNKLAVNIKNKKSYGWFDYSNCRYDSEYSGGYFDPVLYKDHIGIGGEYINLPEPYDISEILQTPYIPTSWLWDDNYFDEFKKEAKKAKPKPTKKHIQTIEKSLKSKLTDEELKYITFK